MMHIYLENYMQFGMVWSLSKKMLEKSANVF